MKLMDPCLRDPGNQVKYDLEVDARSTKLQKIYAPRLDKKGY